MLPLDHPRECPRPAASQEDHSVYFAGKQRRCEIECRLVRFQRNLFHRRRYHGFSAKVGDQLRHLRRAAAFQCQHLAAGEAASSYVGPRGFYTFKIHGYPRFSAMLKKSSKAPTIVSVTRLAASAFRGNNSWPARSTSTSCVVAGMSFSALSISSGVANPSRVPCTNKTFVCKLGKCAVRIWFGEFGGCKG